MRIAVIGRGLIGSAAARHLALAGAEVVLIGPDEPVDRSAHDGVFASHYDEGRITRALDADVFWSRATRPAIARYSEIEAQSGIRFFADCGAMIAGPADGALMQSVAKVQETEGIAADRLVDAALADRFPFFRFAPGTLGYYEPRGAGHISPRTLVKAQTFLAERAGAEVLRTEAVSLRPGEPMVVETRAGEVQADRVLVAAGGFTNTLLPDPLPLKVYARTVTFFEIGEAQEERLDGMPSLVYQSRDARDPYLLPPIRYPNGKTYLKLGGDPDDRVLSTDAEMRAWFRSSGSAQVREHLHAMILDRMPGLQIDAVHSEACVTTFTEEDRPRIAMLTDRLGVATAGCGRGAKCSDELGRRAAEMIRDAA